MIEFEYIVHNLQIHAGILFDSFNKHQTKKKIGSRIASKPGTSAGFK